ncbi:hypothetical protein FIBSPDRAFT_898332 [Athelia psychrophila]|uniref:Uncharacterized protein n=1 Tax=Athelia psychrophila TaxID=1759441 RepID=A0A166B314_9AGAM|nr:hypothetical protein FIBSPDRAFT_898332 [Fibularhizoctonia sp. CBS 109695]
MADKLQEPPFRARNEHLNPTTPTIARRTAERAQVWLDAFQKAWHGDTTLHVIFARYERVRYAERGKERWNDLFRVHLEPIHVSAMMDQRRKARERRMERGRESQERRQDLRRGGGNRDYAEREGLERWSRIREGIRARSYTMG